MKRVSDYLRSAIRNITSNKLYSVFYISGTAVTFVLIILLLSAVRLVSGNIRPFVNAGNTIRVSSNFYDMQGKFVGGISTPDILSFVESVPGAVSFNISNIQYTVAFASGKVRSAAVNFVDSKYFENNDFNFVAGRAFTGNDLPQAVLLKNFADRCYKGDPVGETIEIQKTEYKIAGVVDDFSVLQNPAERAVVWIPYKFDKFVPSGGSPFFDIDIIFDKEMPVREMKENLIHAVKQYFLSNGYRGNTEVRVSPGDFRTVQEKKYDYVGGSAFGYGAAVVLLLLLLVPSLNIMALSSAKIQASAREMAIRRALGATKTGIFRQLLTENILLSVFGFAIAAILAKPFLAGIDRLLFRDESVSSVLSGFRFDFPVYALSLVLVILFALIAGGVPAYKTSRKNIANALKGRDL